jgi:signal peptidase I
MSELPPNRESKATAFLRELITFAVVALVIVVPIRLFIAQPFIVSGESMYPTFDTGEYLIVDQLSYKLAEPSRGDVIIFRYPQNPSKFFIKRIIALPGETLELIGSDVYITDTEGSRFKIDEPYVTMHRDTNLTTEMKDGEYFVMGDNRLASLDSRTWGPLPRDHIIGRAYVRLLPFDTIGFLPGHN